MAKLSDQQREFVRECVANYLDTKAGKPHKTADMAKWTGAAYRRATGEPLKVSADAVRSAITALRDDGYYIARDPKGKGFRCLCGKKYRTPDALGIIESLNHEKGIVASTIENQVARPMEQVRDTIVVRCPDNSVAAVISALRETATIESAVNRVRAIGSEKFVRVTIPESLAERLQLPVSCSEQELKRLPEATQATA